MTLRPSAPATIGRRRSADIAATRRSFRSTARGAGNTRSRQPPARPAEPAVPPPLEILGLGQVGRLGRGTNNSRPAPRRVERAFTARIASAVRAAASASSRPAGLLAIDEAPSRRRPFRARERRHRDRAAGAQARSAPRDFVARRSSSVGSRAATVPRPRREMAVGDGGADQRREHRPQSTRRTARSERLSDRSIDAIERQRFRTSNHGKDSYRRTIKRFKAAPRRSSRDRQAVAGRRPSRAPTIDRRYRRPVRQAIHGGGTAADPASQRLARPTASSSDRARPGPPANQFQGSRGQPRLAAKASRSRRSMRPRQAGEPTARKVRAAERGAGRAEDHSTAQRGLGTRSEARSGRGRGSSAVRSSTSQFQPVEIAFSNRPDRDGGSVRPRNSPYAPGSEEVSGDLDGIARADHARGPQ